jgi:hypothetical protein
MTLNERIADLEQQVIDLTSKVKDLSANTEEKTAKSTTVSGNVRNPSQNLPVDFNANMGAILGNGVIFNDSELKVPERGTEPPDPTTGYNKHSHSRYSGGALIKDVLEIVEYVWGTITNKHSQAFLNLTDADIAPDVNSNGETVKKIGQLDLVFNPDTLTWGCGAYEIDVKKCYLVERDENGDIAVDSKGQQKKSTLYNIDSTKSSIVWDENGACFRFYCTLAPGV